MTQVSKFTHGYALLIGVGGDLPGTVQDAMEIQNILTNPMRSAYPLEHVQLLTGHQATRHRILDGFDWLIECAKKDEQATVIVYFSGHGGYSPEYHLVSTGYNIQNIEKTAISGEEISEKIQAIHAKKLLLLLDCCYAAGITTAKAAGFRPSSIPPDLFKTLAQGSGRVFIASSRQDEVSLTGSPYSVFTQALLEGLAGYGTATRDGYTYIADVALYVGRVVPARTRGKQHPVLDMRHADNFTIAYYAGGAKSPVPLSYAQVTFPQFDRLDDTIIEKYRSIYKQYQQNLAALETRMATFIDQAAVPLDFERAKEYIQQKMIELDKEIQDRV